MCTRAAAPLAVALALLTGCGDGAGEPAPTAAEAPSTTATRPDPPAPADLRRAVRTELATLEGPTTLEAAMDREGVPGLAYAVLQDGEVVLTAAAGSDPTNGSSIEEDTLFQAGSIAKPVTAIVAHALAEDGVIDLGADVADQSERYALPAGEQSAGEPVTLDLLLAHRAGVNVEAVIGYPPDEPLPSVPELLEGEGNTEALEVVRRPGGSTTYSNGGYALAGLLLEEAADAPFPDLADRVVLEPLGMDSSTFAQPLPADRVAEATAGSIEAGRPTPHPFLAYPELGAAGLWATAPDLARLVAGFQAALDDREGAILPAGRAEAMVAYTGTRPGNSVAFGRGWWLDDEAEPTWFWHEGQTIGFSALVAGSLDGRDGIAVVTNNFYGRDVAEQIATTVAERSGWSWHP